jgi:hypothetical protein
MGCAGPRRCLAPCARVSWASWRRSPLDAAAAAWSGGAALTDAIERALTAGALADPWTGRSFHAQPASKAAVPLPLRRTLHGYVGSVRRCGAGAALLCWARVDLDAGSRLRGRVRSHGHHGTADLTYRKRMRPIETVRQARTVITESEKEVPAHDVATTRQRAGCAEPGPEDANNQPTPRHALNSGYTQQATYDDNVKRLNATPNILNAQRCRG